MPTAATAATADAIPPATPDLDRALPGWAVDGIRDGIKSDDARRVYAKCVSIAMSAHLRGWTEQQYVGEIASANSRLWAQLMTHRDGRKRTTLPAAYKALRKAWDAGVANAADVGCRTRDDIRADAVELAYTWADRLDDRTDRLSPTETAVMGFVVGETERRGMLRVTCPRRVVAESCGIGEEAAKGALKRLADRGLLVKHSAGRSGEPGKGKAAIFGLVAVWEEHPIDTGSIPMGCSGVSAVNESGSTDQPTTPTAAKTPHRDTPTGGTPHRDTPDVAHRDTPAPPRPYAQLTAWERDLRLCLRFNTSVDFDTLTYAEIALADDERAAGRSVEDVAKVLEAGRNAAA